MPLQANQTETMNTHSFTAEAREANVKAKVLRNQGKIPAVLYGPGVMEHFTVKHNDVKHLIYTPDFKLGEVEVGGAKHKCIVKSIQYHPITDQINHIDFLALKAGTMVKVEIPVKFKGQSPGVMGGGTLMQTMRKVKVKLDPANMVDELLVDISSLELGDAVRVKDIDLPEGIELMVNEAVPVATVEVPRALKSAEAAAAGEEAAEGAPAEGDAPAAEA